MPPFDSIRTPEELAAEPAFIRWVQQPTPATDDDWQRWMAADANRAVLVQKARALVQLMQFESVSLSPADQQRLEAQLRQKMAATQPLSSELHPTKVRPLWQRTLPRWTAYVAAASVVAILLAGVWFWQHSAGRGGSAQPAWDYTTTYGQTRQIELPDHSIVTLNANSRLRLAPGWASANSPKSIPREVWLDGEAFFDIRKQPTAPSTGTRSAPFTVHSGPLQVTVLGTTFDVNQRRGVTQVVLNTGRIRLEGLPSGNEVMTPGDRVVYRNRGQQSVERTRVNPANYAAWQQGEWVLDNTSLTEIAAMLNDQFGLTVELSDKALAERRLSGRISIESPDIILENLSTILGVSVRRTGKHTILIQP